MYTQIVGELGKQRVVGMTPAEPRQKQTRDQILKAAHACLVEIGFENITTRRIADAAGVNIATLHYYFGTKEALLSAAVAYSLSESERALREAISGAPDAATALEAGLRRAWELVRERKGIIRYDLVVRGLRDEEARRDAVAVYEVFRRLTQEIMERHVASGGTLAGGLTPEQTAQYYISIIDGVVLQHAITHDDEAAKLGLSLILTHAFQLMGIGNGQRTDEPNRF